MAAYLTCRRVKPMTDFEIRAKALDCAIAIKERSDLKFNQMLPNEDGMISDTEDISSLFRLANAIIPYLQGYFQEK
jgi:hypothetical protein